MKTIILISLIALSINASAQTSGVYLNAEDFKSGKLTYAIDCQTEKHKIKLNEFVNKDYITVIHDKQPYNLMKAEIFGYRDCNDVTYRLTRDMHYEVLNPKEEILVYKVMSGGGKGNPITTNYYFSKDANSKIESLTLNTLKAAFPDNHRFHDALDAEFKTDADLAQYDSFHKIYKINRLYSNSLK